MTLKKHVDPIKVTQVHVVSDGAMTKGWVHTHGLAKFDLPELEIRDCPLFLADAAVSTINAISGYLLNSGKKVVLGQTMSLGARCVVTFRRAEPVPGDEEHYADERWEVIDAMTGACELGDR